ncbi:hypothetical protein DFH07DRAFT_948911 [Mycena maculata]|uniref:Uncharacterized protein n=1 Tax=Mycena maculata TaxID=230809 RepID=A0AAD7KIQ1_9AGAR|nr:hypothetical protein DFH07DRAFT_948911 [Mycena maculata]
MLVIDGMYCVLEGLVHYHCYKVLRVDAVVAKKKERGPVALSRIGLQEKQIFAIQSRLVAPFALEDSAEPVEPVDESLVPHVDKDQEMPESGENPVAAPHAANESGAVGKLRKALQSKNLAPLRFVCHSLDLDISGVKLKKADYSDELITWSLTQPRAGFEHDWVSYTDQVDAPYQLKNSAVEEPQVPKIQLLLMQPLGPGEGEVVSNVSAVPDGNEPLAAPLVSPPDAEKSKVETAAAAL